MDHLDPQVFFVRRNAVAKTPSVVTSRWLNSNYGDHAAAVLKDYFQSQDRERGKMRKYTVIKTPLPTKEEFIALRNKRYTYKLTALINDSWGELDSLKDGVQEWYDNLPESFQNGSKGDALNDTISAFDQCNEPTAPDEDSVLGQLEVVCVPGVDNNSRSAQRDEIANQFQAVVDKLQELADMDEKDRPEGLGDDIGTELKEELETLINNMNDIEFPGMFG